jgi:hypothetical protein
MFNLAGGPFAISLFSNKKLLCLCLVAENGVRQPSFLVSSVADRLEK